MRSSLALLLLLLAGCRSRPSEPAPAAPPARSQYLFVWAGDADRRESDFLAVIDANPSSGTYATVVATVPVGMIGTRPHHTEHFLSRGGQLWANGFDSGVTFRFDVRDPLHPRLAGSFRDPEPYHHPHSYVRLPNGNVLATFQMLGSMANHQTGGLVELDSTGIVMRTSPAADSSDPGIRPYSLVVLPGLDRVVTTATDMHLQARSSAVQIWRLSDLRLLQTLQLPPGPRGDEHRMTAEPWVLNDGRTVMVNTFTCGLYVLSRLDQHPVRAEWVWSTPWREPPFCALPVTEGNYWIYASNPDRAVVSLDVENRRRVREAGRVQLGPDEVPHWLALEPGGDRIVITGYRGMESRVLIARLNRLTGALTLDSTFSTPGAALPGVSLDRERWPHGTTGRAIPHGAVFSNP